MDPLAVKSSPLYWHRALSYDAEDEVYCDGCHELVEGKARKAYGLIGNHLDDAEERSLGVFHIGCEP